MTKKANIHEADFEAFFDNALKSHGYLFPETDEQMSIFEENMDDIPLPEEFQNPDFVFDAKKRTFKRKMVIIDNSEAEMNWALAAREGKVITDEMRAKMKKDKEEAKNKLNGDK
jgi:DNA-binding response OmpR family regulator